MFKLWVKDSRFCHSQVEIVACIKLTLQERVANIGKESQLTVADSSQSIIVFKVVT